VGLVVEVLVQIQLQALVVLEHQVKDLLVEMDLQQVLLGVLAVEEVLALLV
jgi:hypothetical protein